MFISPPPRIPAAEARRGGRRSVPAARIVVLLEAIPARQRPVPRRRARRVRSRASGSSLHLSFMPPPAGVVDILGVQGADVLKVVELARRRAIMSAPRRTARAACP